MEVCSIDQAVPSSSGMVVALSVFDGVHRGHRAILSEVKRIAGEQQLPVGVLVVEGGVHYGARMLTTLEHRLELLEQVGGIATAWVIPADVHERPAEVVGFALDRIRPAILCASAVLLNLGRQERLMPDELAALCEARDIAMSWLDGVLPGRSGSTERLYTTRYISDLLDVATFPSRGACSAVRTRSADTSSTVTTEGAQLVCPQPISAFLRLSSFQRKASMPASRLPRTIAGTRRQFLSGGGRRSTKMVGNYWRHTFLISTTTSTAPDFVLCSPITCESSSASPALRTSSSSS